MMLKHEWYLDHIGNMFVWWNGWYGRAVAFVVRSRRRILIIIGNTVKLCVCVCVVVRTFCWSEYQVGDGCTTHTWFDRSRWNILLACGLRLVGGVERAQWQSRMYTPTVVVCCMGCWFQTCAHTMNRWFLPNVHENLQRWFSPCVNRERGIYISTIYIKREFVWCLELQCWFSASVFWMEGEFENG